MEGTACRDGQVQLGYDAAVDVVGRRVGVGIVKLTHHTQSAPADFGKAPADYAETAPTDSGNQSSTEYPPATAMTTKAIFHRRQVIDNLERSPGNISRTTQSSLGKEVNKERKKFFLPKTCCCQYI
jgi:hypothetical protein